MKTSLIKIKGPGPLKYCFPRVLWHGNRRGSTVYITFDDGPHSDYTPRVLDILNQNHALATFFCKGFNVENYPKIIKRIISEGHTIGNHGFTHQSLLFKNQGFIEKEIWHTHQAIQQTTQTKTCLFRPPYGLFRPSIKHLLHKFNYQMVIWDLLTYDFSEKNSDALIRRVKNHIKPGSILVFHDGHRNAPVMIKAFPHILQMIRQLGYKSEALSKDVQT